jgi:putative transposase
MVGKRHSFNEIASKLDQAGDLAAKGRTQKDIARLLGVSVMTFHRWRKKQEGQPELVSQVPVSSAGHETLEKHLPDPSEPRLLQVQLENSRLRRVVMDLLLEKARLEEELTRVGLQGLSRHKGSL